MDEQNESIEVEIKADRYPVHYPHSAYTFPKGARIFAARFDNQYVHIELMDGRILAIPLTWIPTLANAEPEDREQFAIDETRTMLVWDPAVCAIDDQLRVMDYLQ